MTKSNVAVIKTIAKQADKVAVAKGQKRKGAVSRVQSNNVANITVVKEQAKLALTVWGKVKRAEGTLFNHHLTLGDHLKVIRDQYLSNNEYNGALKEHGLDGIDASVRSQCLYVATHIAEIKDLQRTDKLPKSKSVQVLYRAHKKLKADAPKPKADAPKPKADAPKAATKAEPKADAPKPKAEPKATNEGIAEMIVGILKENPQLDWETIAELVDKS